MGRRKDELTLLMEAASRWPWKVPATLVPLSYVACHLLAEAFASITVPVSPTDLAPAIIRQGIHTFATLFQYALPAIFSAAAVVSFISRSRSIALFDDVRNESAVNVADLSWGDFEKLVGEGFRRRGFDVAERAGGGPDGGVDLMLAKGHERFLVQCKQWRAQQVGVSVVRELYGVMAAERAAGGYVVTSGNFTKDARQFASGRNIELIDGRALNALLRNTQNGAPASSCTRVATLSANEGLPMCPTCKTPMVRRTAKKGSNAGGSFWGCAQYPKCRQTLAIQGR
jgi:restriction system protein